MQVPIDRLYKFAADLGVPTFVLIVMLMTLYQPIQYGVGIAQRVDALMISQEAAMTNLADRLRRVELVCTPARQPQTPRQTLAEGGPHGEYLARIRAHTYTGGDGRGTVSRGAVRRVA